VGIEGEKLIVFWMKSYHKYGQTAQLTSRKNKKLLKNNHLTFSYTFQGRCGTHTCLSRIMKDPNISKSDSLLNSQIKYSPNSGILLSFSLESPKVKATHCLKP
jgi:hypothetical protein